MRSFLSYKGGCQSGYKEPIPAVVNPRNKRWRPLISSAFILIKTSKKIVQPMQYYTTPGAATVQMPYGTPHGCYNPYHPFKAKSFEPCTATKTPSQGMLSHVIVLIRSCGFTQKRHHDDKSRVILIHFVGGLITHNSISVDSFPPQQQRQQQHNTPGDYIGVIVVRELMVSIYHWLERERIAWQNGGKEWVHQRAREMWLPPGPWFAAL